MAKSKKTTTKKAEPKPKKEEVKAVEVAAQPELQPVEEPQNETHDSEEIFVLDGDSQLLHKAVIGCSKIWANDLLAAQNKYFERYFFLEKNAEVEVGTKIFTDDGLSLPFIGMDFWITISKTEGEHNPKWAACRVNNQGIITCVVHL